MTKKNLVCQTVISPDSAQNEYLKDVFRYRELFYFIARRDIVVRYKQTYLGGVIWAIVRPLITMAVFTFVFGKVANLATSQENYPLFVLSGVLPWMFFSGSLMDTSNSLINHVNMIAKVYFPRIILPIGTIMVHFVDFLIGLVTLIVLLLLMGRVSIGPLLVLPIFVLFCVVLCIGSGLWVSAINVRYRDFRFIVPFLVQFGVFISPVGYSAFLMPPRWQWIYFLNPMVGIIEGFRWCCLGVYHEALPLAILLSCVMNFVILMTGFRFFRKIERICADII